MVDVIAMATTACRSITSIGGKHGAMVSCIGSTVRPGDSAANTILTPAFITADRSSATQTTHSTFYPHTQP